MTKPVQTYDGQDVTVTFDPNVCIHSAVCLRSLPGVFDTKRRRWIDPGGAAPEAVVDTVRQCPSGALQVRRANAPAREEPSGAPTESVTTIEPVTDGPIRIQGTLRILGPDGSAEDRVGKVFLCRCGASARKPYCDGSHKRVGFRSAKTAAS